MRSIVKKHAAGKKTRKEWNGLIVANITGPPFRVLADTLQGRKVNKK